LKSTLSLRSVYPIPKDNLIGSHVMLCWHALFLVLIAELETSMTSHRLGAELERIFLGKFLHKNDHILEHTEMTKKQRNIL